MGAEGAFAYRLWSRIGGQRLWNGALSVLAVGWLLDRFAINETEYWDYFDKIFWLDSVMTAAKEDGSPPPGNEP